MSRDSLQYRRCKWPPVSLSKLRNVRDVLLILQCYCQGAVLLAIYENVWALHSSKETRVQPFQNLHL